MRKQLLALATLALAGSASAQSSVTIFGVVDVAVSGSANKSEDRNRPTILNPFYLNRGDVTVSRTELRHSGHTTSRLGFRGTEDLGGGLAASFWLEAPITPDDGATGIASFVRRSTVSLSGSFGEVRLGRDLTPTFLNDALFDPFGAVGNGSSLIFTSSNFNTTGGAGGFGGSLNQVRASNSISYFLPSDLGGFYGQAMYAFHERDKYEPGTTTPPGINSATGLPNAGASSPSRAGRYIAGRFGYASGPLDVAMSYGATTVADNYFAGTTDSVKTVNLGASYDFGVIKLMAEWSRLKNERDYAALPVGTLARRDIDLTGYLVGFTVPVGPGLIRAAYSRVKYDQNIVASPFTPTAADPKADKIALGYVHFLSKRTALYATVARVNNKNGAALTVNGPAFISNAIFTPKTSTGYDVGIRHTF